MRSGPPKSITASFKSNKVGLTDKTIRGLLLRVTVDNNLPMLLAALVAMTTVNGATDPPVTADDLVAGRFRWTVGPPLVSPADRPDDPCHAIKDPSIVFQEGRWHLFATIRSQTRTHQIEYLSFTDWKEANQAERHLLKICDGYFCAPQVFYFSRHKKWYLIFQTSDPSRKPELQPAFSTAASVSDPGSWSKPTWLFDTQPTDVARWIDFWVICDESKAHLFFTSLDGRMWRCETKLSDFPKGWTQPSVVLRDDIFEASHTYRLRGLNKFLTLIEAQDGDRRYYKAYLADRLDGDW